MIVKFHRESINADLQARGGKPLSGYRSIIIASLTVKYEELYLKANTSVTEVRIGIGK